jgi:hypothetical protein
MPPYFQFDQITPHYGECSFPVFGEILKGIDHRADACSNAITYREYMAGTKREAVFNYPVLGDSYGERVG